MPDALSYEIKLYLDPDQVLTPTGEPTPEVAEAFRLAVDPVRMSAAFLDTKALDLHTERWNVRFRVKAGGTPELSFKRRLPVDVGVEAALELAGRQGFKFRTNPDDESGYETQVEWGLARQTLSLVKEHKVSGAALPKAAEARALVLKKMPGKLRRWVGDDWARRVVGEARRFGPIEDITRWTGSHPDIGPRLTLEVWPLRPKHGAAERLVEVSFKQAGTAAAEAAQERLVAVVKAKGWLVPEDVLKTERILKVYR